MYTSTFEKSCKKRYDVETPDTQWASLRSHLTKILRSIFFELPYSALFCHTPPWAEQKGILVERMERLYSAKKQKVKAEEHLRDTRGVERRHRNKNVFRIYGPVDYAKTLKLRLRVGGLDLPERKKKTVMPVAENKLNRCALVAKQ